MYYIIIMSGGIKMNELIEKENKIRKMIYEIRGKEVMLDSDLALLYGVETKRINEAVKRNPNKFPERFSWKLTEEESKLCLVAKCDQKIETRGGKYKNPQVFTEQGVAMLATILKSQKAIEVSIAIMDAFVAMRHYLIENKDIYQSLNNLNNEIMNHKQILIEHNHKFEELFSNFKQTELKEKIFFNRQFYDSYSKLIDIMNEAKEELIIIDSYADKTVLDMISKINSKVVLITKSKGLLKDIDIKKYNAQYNNLKVIHNNDFHDRFIIIKKEIIYHLGTSLNSVGKKIFAINRLEEESIKQNFLDKVKFVIGDKKRL